MKKKFRRALFIFRRDLRLQDNIGLIFALQNAELVIPVFIFTPEQIIHNSYKSEHCLQFMIESLEDLEKQLEKQGGQLFLFFDKAEKIVAQCIEQCHVDGVIVNRDYTPYSVARDLRIEKVCQKKRVPFHSFDDALLQPPGYVMKSDGSPYTIFTPFYTKAHAMKIDLPQKHRGNHYFDGKISFAHKNSIYHKILPTRSLKCLGGRKNALQILKNLHRYSDKPSERDFPWKNKTTRLSAHLKFTTCSCREVYYAMEKQWGKHSDVIRSMFWRDFFTHIAFYFPKIFQGAFHAKFYKIPWKNSRKAFYQWCQGKTGFPIVDAAMRELNETGYIHNRLRMIVASFLVKDLHIDWRWGEKYFAQKLLDYDPSVNNGNWQWVASTGCDAQPYFRIFNPWLQQKKFDPQCAYIRQWIKELEAVSSSKIHQWDQPQESDVYRRPILDHAKEATKTVRAYKHLVRPASKI
ncbi:MAG: deoxyribodipyrimidine photo-lyase [Parachlamydiales bacterium]|nr:deoxyribodipyrimidine photo-lyase [Parachlamydiales bacterium]